MVGWMISGVRRLTPALGALGSDDRSVLCSTTRSSNGSNARCPISLVLEREINARCQHAKEALELVEALQRSDEEIKFIRAPAEGEIGVEMLRVLVSEEGFD